MSSALFEQLGGEAYFEALVARFYQGVRGDELLAPMYAGDFDGGQRRLTLFLIQYWGGPGTYSQERGHPMLRRRHLPFHVGPAARERWLAHMRAALDEVPAGGGLDGALWDYFQRAAFAMQNATEDLASPPGGQL